MQQTGVVLRRRRALALAGGLALTPLSAARAATAESNVVAPIMTRPIPSTGEPLPVVGLGTDQNWRNDLPATHAAFTEVIRTLANGGGRVIDTASNWGTAASLGVRRQSLADAGMYRWLGGIAVRSRNQACHCRSRSEPGAGDWPLVATSASAAIYSFGGSPGNWPSPR